jgi:hypothetical protein
MTDMEKSSRASTDVEAQELNAAKEAPVALPGQQAAEPIDATAAETAPAGMPTFPEGGRRGWLAVTGGWAVMFVTFGYVSVIANN